MFKIMKYMSARDWALIVASIGLIVAGVWFDLAIPRRLADIVGIIGDPSGGHTTADIWAHGGMMLVYAAGSMATAFVVAYIGAVVSANHGRRVRQAIFDKVASLSQTEVKNITVPSLITRSTGDVEQVRMFVSMAIMLLVRAPLTAAWALIEMTSVSHYLAYVTLGAVASLFVVIVFLIIFVMPRYNRIQKLTDELNKVTRENLTGIRVIRAYNAEEMAREKFHVANNNLVNNNLFVNRLMSMFWPFLFSMLSLVSVGIYWVGSWVLDTGRTADPMFIASMVQFNQYSVNIIFSFVMLIFVFIMLPRTLVSARRIVEVIGMETTIVSGHVMQAPENMDIEFHGVGFKYEDAEASVLADINIKIKAGTTVAFIGGTGSGKSTLVNMIPRIYDKTEGKITIGGIDIRDFDLATLASFVGHVPQKAVIMNGTIKSNVAFGDANAGQRDAGPNIGLDDAEISIIEHASDENVIAALKTAQAWEFVQKMEGNIEAEVTAGGKNLSGGQKQRLSIARTLARRPKILVFDDTFSALDYVTDKNLRTALKNDLADVTKIIVAQRIGTIREADQINVMVAGRIVSTGTHDELMNKCAVYKEIADSQIQAE